MFVFVCLLCSKIRNVITHLGFCINLYNFYKTV